MEYAQRTWIMCISVFSLNVFVCEWAKYKEMFYCMGC